MKLENLVQKEPVLDKNDPISHVRNLMNRFSIPELPVIGDSELLGTITAKRLIASLKRFDIEDLIAQHLMEEDFIKLSLETKIKDIVKGFLEKQRFIACFLEEEFEGYVQRIKLLNFLLESRERIENYIFKEFVCIESDERIKKLVKALEKEKPMVLLKNGKMINAFLPEELYSLSFIADYVTRKLERKFETLRADQRKLLRFRRNQQLLSYIKETTDFTYLPPLKVGDVLSKGIILSSKDKIGKVARLMFEFKKNVLVVEDRGIVTDLSLLRALI